MERTGHSPQFTGTTSDQHRHICAFFNSIDEQHRVLRPFIKDGFERGEKAYHYVDPELREEHLRWLADAGVNVQEAMGTGQLEVQPWQDSTLRGGRFDLDAWLTSFEQLLQSGPAEGYVQTNFMGHMEWALADLPGVGDLIEYETRVNYVIPKYEGPVICTYDLRKFGARGSSRPRTKRGGESSGTCTTECNSGSSHSRLTSGGRRRWSQPNCANCRRSCLEWRMAWRALWRSCRRSHAAYTRPSSPRVDSRPRSRPWPGGQPFLSC